MTVNDLKRILDIVAIASGECEIIIEVAKNIDIDEEGIFNEKSYITLGAGKCGFDFDKNFFVIGSNEEI